MFSSLRFRLWLTYALVIGVLISIAGAAVVLYLLRNPSNDRQELQRLRLYSALVLQRGQLLNLPRGAFNQARLQELAERVDEAIGVRVAVFNSAGEVLADSRWGSEAPLPATIVDGQRSGSQSIFRDSARRQWLYSITPVQGGNYLLLATPRAQTSALAVLRDEFLTPFMRGGLLALGLSLLLAIWIAHWVTAPLQRIAGAARDASVGQFRQIRLQGPREVRALARVFNEMVERVEASQRSQRDFVANVSHDLKTPITSIQGFAQAIVDGTADDPDAVHQAAEVIYDEAGRMHRMVLELLELARLDAGIMGFEMAPLDVDDLLRDAVEKFAFQADQVQVVLRFSPGRDLPRIVGDADRLAQVFANLVDNAIKHTPAGGEVWLSSQQVDEWMQVNVADTGAGIPDDELDRIFERFYQMDKSRRGGSRRGVGLGLAIAREIVVAHGGSLSAHNRKDFDASDGLFAESGSIFIVRLPRARPDDETISKRRR
jgi:signal transduction histidine kinase